MKQPIYQIILSHPILQLAVFLCIVIGGQLFAAPYGWILRYAIVTGEFFAITGIFGFVFTLLSVFGLRSVFQITGLAAMWLSLTTFYLQTQPVARDYMFENPLTVISLLLFVFVSVCIILNYMKWKNF